MKALTAVCIIAMLAMACTSQQSKENTSTSIAGTWQLLTAKSITGKDTTTTYPVPNQEMIKIFTADNHFAFLRHDLNMGKDTTAYYDSGAGTYTLSGENYSEHLSYCSARGWENKDFNFTLTVRNDTLIQKGIEKIDSLKIDHEIVEIYTRKK